MCPAIGAIGRILVHETLAILATDLRDLLLRHLTLRRHPISWHWLSVAWARRGAVGWVGIVSRVVSRWAIALLHRISAWHVAWPLLGHATGGGQRHPFFLLRGVPTATFD